MKMKRLFGTWCLVLLGLSACQAQDDSHGPLEKGRSDAEPRVDEFVVPYGLIQQYRGEPTHRGVAPPHASLSGPLSLVWTSGPYGKGHYDASKSSPVVDHALVYVGEDDGVLRALERDSGRVRWAFATHRHFEELSRADDSFTGIHGTPAYDEERVYIGDYSGYMYAIERDTGKLVWERQLGGSIGSSPVLAQGFLWIAVEYPELDGRVFKLERRTGTVVTSSPYLGHHIHGTVSISASMDRLVVGTNRGTLFGLASSTLAVEARIEFGEPIKSTAALDDQLAYVTAWDGALHVLELSKMVERYSSITSEKSMSSPAIYDRTLCFGSHDRTLRCIERETGALLWKVETMGFVQSSPTIVESSKLVVVGSADNHVYAFRLNDGELVSRYELAAPITSVIAVVEESLFVNDDSGTVYRLDCP